MISRRFKMYNIFTTSIVSTILLISIWNISIFFIPIQILILIVTSPILKRGKLSLRILDVLLISLIIFEIVDLFFSLYPTNSVLYLFELLTVLYTILIIRHLFLFNRFKLLCLILISSIALCMSLFNIFLFTFKYYESTICGFTDFTQFRYLYKPIGILSNEWVTALFCLLPFPVIGYFLSIKNSDNINSLYTKAIKYLFVISFLLIIFNIFISFSRAAYFSFILWIVLMNTFFYILKLTTLKTQLLSNLILVLFVVILSFVFSNSIHSTLYASNSHMRSTESRYTQWYNAIQIAKQYPLLGIGAKNYPLISCKWQDKNPDSNFSGRVNNTYIQLLLEKGIIGFVLWLLLILYFIYILFKNIKSSNRVIDIIINTIIISTILSVLFRELFFSSLLCNSGILFLLILSSLFIEMKTINLTFSSKMYLIYCFILEAIFLFLYIFNMFEIFNYNKSIRSNYSKVIFDFPQISIVGNSLLYLVNALKHERNSTLHINWCSIVTDNCIFEYDKEILNAIYCCKMACIINPYDATMYHNMSWLYYLSNQKDKALIYIERAIDYSYSTALFHISKGLMIEHQNLNAALNEYEIAITLSPDICETDFFTDFRHRNPNSVLSLLNNVYTSLCLAQSLNNSTITEAKIGKILLSLGKLDESYKILNHVTKNHPNLSRPWYYLGIIEYCNGNIRDMKMDIRKSIFLNGSDYLPLYLLAYYYNSIKDKGNTEIYKKIAVKNWKSKPSIHSLRSKRIYYLNTINDDIIPKGLLNYTSPKFKINCI